MNVLFCHSNKFKQDENGVFYSISHNNASLSRYYSIADEIRILGCLKKGDASECQKLSAITIKPLSFVECPNTSTLKGLFFRSKCRSIVFDDVSKADFIVARLPSSIGNLAVQAARELHKPYMVLHFPHFFKRRVLKISPVEEFSLEYRRFSPRQYSLKKSQTLFFSQPNRVCSDAAGDDLIRAEFVHKFGKNTALTIERVEEIPREKSGKFRMIVNNVE